MARVKLTACLERVIFFKLSRRSPISWIISSVIDSWCHFVRDRNSHALPPVHWYVARIHGTPPNKAVELALIGCTRLWLYWIYLLISGVTLRIKYKTYGFPWCIYFLRWEDIHWNYVCDPTTAGFWEFWDMGTIYYSLDLNSVRVHRLNWCCIRRCCRNKHRRHRQFIIHMIRILSNISYK